MKKFLSILPIVLLVGFVAAFVAQATGLSMFIATPATVAGMALLSHLPGAADRGAFAAGIQTEVWVNHIVENFFKNNEFALRSIDQSEHVNHRTVHIPQAGSKPTFEKNRVLGGAATNTVQRTDTVLEYSIDEWTSEPFLITNAENVELSYRKRESVLRELQQEMRDTLFGDLIYKWAATAGSSANILRTTGFLNNDVSAAVSTAANVNSTATGQRLVFGLYDVRKAFQFLNNQNVPMEGRCMLVSSNMYDQLVADLIATKYRDASNLFDMKEGVITRVMGFDIYVRSEVLTYTNAATPVRKAPGAAAAETDNDVAIFWQEGQVARAMGDTHVYETINSAVHYGDVYSILNRFGGTKNRSTEIGVGAIVQAHAN